MNTPFRVSFSRGTPSHLSLPNRCHWVGGECRACDDRCVIARDTVKPALLVLALAVAMSIVLPSIDSRTTYHDQVHRGEVAQVADRITLVPTAGWQLASGALVGHARSPVGTTATTELVRGSVDFYVHAAPFTGTPSALLTRLEQISASVHHRRERTAANTHRYAVTTRQGVVGIAEDFIGVARQGTVTAFVFTARGLSPAEGLEVAVSGARDGIARRRDDIVTMIRSIRAGQ